MVSIRRKGKPHLPKTWSPFVGGRCSRALPHFHFPAVGSESMESEGLVETVRASAASIQGRQRTVMQDQCFADPETGLFIVVDGTGGYCGGELASRFIVQRLMLLLDPSNMLAEDVEEHIQSSLQRVQRELNSIARRIPLLADMGASLALLLVQNQQAYLCHIGNCRIYRYRGDGIEQMTHDQTTIHPLLNWRAVTTSQAQHHPLRQMTANVLGARPLKRPSMRCEPVFAGDRYLLVTDGVSTTVDALTLRELAMTVETPDGLAQQVVREAVQHRSPDDMSCVVVDMV